MLGRPAEQVKGRLCETFLALDVTRCPDRRLRVAISEAQLRSPLTIARLLSTLTAPAEVCFTNQERAFCLLNWSDWEFGNPQQDMGLLNALEAGDPAVAAQHRTWVNCLADAFAPIEAGVRPSFWWPKWAISDRHALSWHVQTARRRVASCHSKLPERCLRVRQLGYSSFAPFRM
jgi:hypothetical protein